MNTQQKSHYVLAGLLALVAAFPLVVDTEGKVLLDASVTNLREQVKENKDTFRNTRRDYEDAIALCSKRQKDGEDVVCPDVNDPVGIQRFLKGLPSEHEAAPATNVALKLSNLDDTQAGLLRRYQRAHACPDSMEEILPGFKALCLSLMPDVPAAITSVVHARVKATQGPKRDGQFTLDELIDAKKGARPVR